MRYNITVKTINCHGDKSKYRLVEKYFTSLIKIFELVVSLMVIMWINLM